MPGTDRNFSPLPPKVALECPQTLILRVTTAIYLSGNLPGREVDHLHLVTTGGMRGTTSRLQNSFSRYGQKFSQKDKFIFNLTSTDARDQISRL
jgi:hypothetical protein